MYQQKKSTQKTLFHFFSSSNNQNTTERSHDPTFDIILKNNPQSQGKDEQQKDKSTDKGNGNECTKKSAEQKENRASLKAFAFGTKQKMECSSCDYDALENHINARPTKDSTLKDISLQSLNARTVEESTLIKTRRASHNENNAKLAAPVEPLCLKPLEGNSSLKSDETRIKEDEADLLEEETVDYGEEREGPSELEKLRQERIARNQAFLKSLGIGSMKRGVGLQPTTTKPRLSGMKRKSKSLSQSQGPMETPAPVRRSRRQRRTAPESYEEDALFEAQKVNVPGQVEQEEAQKEEEEEEIDFDDSSVIKYVCDTTSSLRFSKESSPQGGLKGLQLIGTAMFAEHLTAIYSMHISPVAPLLVAGGKAGGVAIFSPLAEDQSEDDGDLGNRVLMNFKAHRSWISGVCFIAENPNANCTLLLTSANDGLVKMWDVSKQHRGMPKMEWTADHVHMNGIFSMHCFEQHVATGSKDKRVAVSALRETGNIEKISQFSSHERIVKCVHMRDDNVLASSGDDCIVNVYDRRSPQPTSQMENVHEQSVHSVRWSPSEPQHLVTAGLDPYIHLYDLRCLDRPVLSFRGHSSSRVQKYKTIHRPEFYSDGAHLITGGQGCSQLSLYDTKSGKTVSRGAFSNDILSIASTSLTTTAFPNNMVFASLPDGNVVCLSSIYGNSL